MLQIWLAVSEGDTPTPPAPPELAGADCRLAAESCGSRRIELRARPPARAGGLLATSAEEYALRVGRTQGPPPDPAEAEDPQVRIDRRDGSVEVETPLTTTRPLFWTRRGGQTILGSDPRWLAPTPRHLDETGLYALLQFGALVPPATLWREVHRYEPGTRARLAPDRATWTESALPFWTAPLEPPPRTPPPHLPSAAEQEARVADLLDGALRQAAPDRRPLILFSGGVDSGLLAAQARALGWNETLLCNYRMGPDDPEAALARTMAEYLQLPLRTIDDTPEGWLRALERFASAYPMPLGDYSAAPTWLLCEGVRPALAGRAAVLDGTGADALFRTFPKLTRWARLYHLPLPLRRLAGAAYHGAGRWRADRRLDRYLSAARISARLPYRLASMVAENPLCGIAYRPATGIRAAVQERLLAWARVHFPPADGDAFSRGLDLVHVVCGLTAQKDAPLFDGAPEDLVYPFLHPALVRLAFQEARHWPEQRTSKAVLKRLLQRHVPRAMVERPKSGFLPPLHRELREPRLASAVRERLLDSGNPLRPYLEMGVIARLIELASAGRPLAHTTYNFLWTVLAVTLWLQGNTTTTAATGWGGER